MTGLVVLCPLLRKYKTHHQKKEKDKVKNKKYLLCSL
jgi:hypothetical protein